MATPAWLHVESVYQNGISTDVHQVHHQGSDHGDSGVSHGAEHGSAGIVNGQEGIGKCHEEKVNPCIFHDVRGSLSENGGQNAFVSKQSDDGNHQGHGSGSQKQLFSGLMGMFFIFCAKSLGDDYRAAGCEGGEKNRQQDI